MEQQLKDIIKDLSVKSQKGRAFILSSCFIWTVILAISLLPSSVQFKSFATLACGALLFPVSIATGKLLGINIFDKSNPLINGVLFATNNQILYLLICMILAVYYPNVTIFAYSLIYGAHLLPYGFFYSSKAYISVSVLISAGTFILYCIFKDTIFFCYPLLVLVSDIYLFFALGKELRD